MNNEGNKEIKNFSNPEYVKSFIEHGNKIIEKINHALSNHLNQQNEIANDISSYIELLKPISSINETFFKKCDNYFKECKEQELIANSIKIINDRINVYSQTKDTNDFYKNLLDKREKEGEKDTQNNNDIDYYVLANTFLVLTAVLIVLLFAFGIGADHKLNQLGKSVLVPLSTLSFVAGAVAAVLLVIENKDSVDKEQNPEENKDKQLNHSGMQNQEKEKSSSKDIVKSEEHDNDKQKSILNNDNEQQNNQSHQELLNTQQNNNNQQIQQISQ